MELAMFSFIVSLINFSSFELNFFKGKLNPPHIFLKNFPWLY
ncbi:hypothetical protein sm9_1225 [Methanobrevibacter millerae]|uniref:Uncharacterized protein n=1 Tax=Methanobrevibacter millerae TaxID=230361 RepID=A0A0U2L5N6_9EURY|nr:hypothetical protein sm9_1225 [Methanobrevibacter millerae]